DEDSENDGFQVVNVSLKEIEAGRPSIHTTAAYGVGVCNGDSGGPLFESEGRKNTIVGVMSSGNTCDI
ncbi:hypothetical protein COOONC_26028, partial [Cooperia oncophora]